MGRQVQISDGNISVTARITMRGFKDAQQDCEAVAGTVTIMSQILVASATALRQNWEQWCFDVPQPFANGMAFE